ncbi:hypothetical protein BJX76DRAFT_357395 [Aspergillus varians]
MNTDTDAERTAPPSHIHEFTPVNSSKGEEMNEANTTMNTDGNDQASSSTKTEEAAERALTSMTAKAEANNPASGTTPRKRSRNTAASNSTTTPTKKSRKRKDTTSPGDAEPCTPGTGTKNGEETPTRAALPRIPTSLSEAGMQDKLILKLRDDDNLPWSKVTKQFESITETSVGASTLRMRYTTMKANFTGISEEDEARLFRFKKEIEGKFESEKWQRIGEAIIQDGGAKYSAAALQKKFKELSKNMKNASVNSGAAGKDSNNEE